LPKPKTVKEYLRELRETKKEKPTQIREALDIYLDLWEQALQKAIVAQEDEIDVALSKIDSRGGLYRVSEEETR
jgi:hypothetical protein